MQENTNHESASVQIVQGSSDLQADMDFLTNLGFKLFQIYPADNPVVAIMIGHGIRIRLDKNVDVHPSEVQLLTEKPKTLIDGKMEVTAPNGTIFKVLPNSDKMIIPDTKHNFEVRQLVDSEPWIIGRAGMKYRDLIPDRLGGSVIASHIHIPNSGPVPDIIHYHTIGFQLIFCYKGWVRLVYEDQGPPFILNAGDCVTQPPEIRHRVLESSDNLEVIEIGVPAVHMTTIDYEMELPTDKVLPGRKFQGQTFCHHQLKDANWREWKIPGFQFRDTGVYEATNHIASVVVARNNEKGLNTRTLNHQGDILFYFVMDGSCMLDVDGHSPYSLKPGDAFVIPPDIAYRMKNCSSDVELLEIFLPRSLN